MVPPIYGKVRFFTFEMPDILCLYRWKVFKKVIPFHKAKPLIMGNLNRSACILHRLLSSLDGVLGPSKLYLSRLPE